MFLQAIHDKDETKSSRTCLGHLLRERKVCSTFRVQFGKKHLTLSRHSQLKYRLVQNTPQLLENLSGLTSISVHMFLLEGEQLRKKVLAANSLYSKAKSVLIEKSRKGKLSAEEMERSVTLVDRINDNRLKVFNQVFG